MRWSQPFREDVQRYVSREKVPRVLLSGDRLWIKFDKALSKYAFAKAVAKESVDGNTEVVKNRPRRSA